MAAQAKTAVALKSLLDAIGLSDKVVSAAGRILEVVTSVASGWEQTQAELQKSLGSNEKAERHELLQLIRDVRESAELFQQSCTSLNVRWQSMKEIMETPLKQNVANLEFIKTCTQALEALLKRTVECGEKYAIFKEHLDLAVRCAVNLVEQAKNQAEEAERQASNTRTTGYTSSAFFFGAAFIAATLLTGGAAAVAAVAAGAAGIGAGVYTKETAARMDKLKDNFYELIHRLESSLKDLGTLGDNLVNLRTATEDMANQISEMKLLALLAEEKANNQAQVRMQENQLLVNGKESKHLENGWKGAESEDLRKKPVQACVCSVL